MPDSVERSVKLTSPPADVNAIHDFLQTIWSETPDVSELDRLSLETALVELAANVFRHADTTGAGLTYEMTIRVDNEAISLTLRDTGEPGNITLVGLTMPELDAESGRGLALIDALVDELEYVRDGDHNQWRVRKKRSSA